MFDLSRILIISGVVLITAGIAITLLSGLTGILKLPGDIFIKKGNFTFYFPIVTSIILSIILTILLNFFFRK